MTGGTRVTSVSMTVHEQHNEVQDIRHNYVHISLFLGSSKQRAYSLANSNFDSRLAQTLLEDGHQMGTMEDIMQMLHLTDMEPHNKNQQALLDRHTNQCTHLNCLH